MYNAIKGTDRKLIRNGTYWVEENNGEWLYVVDAESYAPDFVLVVTWIEDEEGNAVNSHKELVPFAKFKQLTFSV